MTLLPVSSLTWIVYILEKRTISQNVSGVQMNEDGAWKEERGADHELQSKVPVEGLLKSVWTFSGISS